MDIVHILKKANKSVKDLSIKVTGEISKSLPVEYVRIYVVYEFSGDPENSQAAIDAVNDSQEKFCGRSICLKKSFP